MLHITVQKRAQIWMLLRVETSVVRNECQALLEPAMQTLDHAIALRVIGCCRLELDTRQCCEILFEQILDKLWAIVTEQESRRTEKRDPIIVSDHDVQRAD